MPGDHKRQANRSWPIGAGCTGQVIDIFQADPRRSSLHGGWRGGLSGADFGLRLGGQDEFELIEQERELGFWFGVAGQQQLSAVGRRDMQINHLHGGELFDGAARREARRQGMEAPAECDMEAIGEEGDEDMRLDARCILVKDRPDGEVAPRLRGGRLLRFLNASSTLTSWRYKPHSRAGSVLHGFRYSVYVRMRGATPRSGASPPGPA